jgi:hypothetical protein
MSQLVFLMAMGMFSLRYKANFCAILIYYGSGDNVVGIENILRAGESAVRIPVGASDFSLLQNERVWGPISLIFNRYRGFFSGAKETRA